MKTNEKRAGPGDGRPRMGIGFTLIELLVVIVIIAILAGIALQVTVLVNNKMGRARAVRDLHAMKNALAEYHSTFGIYPPTTLMSWEYSNNLPKYTISNMNYCTGLVYYLSAIPESAKWKPMLEGVMPNSIGVPAYSNWAGGFGYVFWSNNVKNCLDPWGGSYIYSCTSPYQSFKLWSAGPTSSTNDDVGVSWDE